MSGTYYNEIEPFAAAWLRELIKGGHIAAGEVDTRSIEDVRPDDLRGFDQCHFFAGIGGWSLALRRAGWPDDRPVWTGSCPCQPFSSAGQGAGFNDERHLWPSFYWLIQECRPAVVAGEQVASKDADPWLDLVQDDLEAMGYAFGAVAFPSAGVGAPHIRDRTYWMAHAHGTGSLPGAQRRIHRSKEGAGPRHGEFERSGATGRLAQYYCHGCSAPAVPGIRNPESHAKSCSGAGRLADAELPGAARYGCDSRARETEARIRDRLADSYSIGRMADANGGQFDGLSVVRGLECDGKDCGRTKSCSELEPCSDVCGVADADGEQQRGINRTEGKTASCHEGKMGQQDGERVRPINAGGCSSVRHAGPTNGLWRAADWLLCRDGKWRPVEPGTFPLAHGLPARVGRLRGYGNAINAEQAALFVEVMRELYEGSSHVSD
ncbi:DNA cytosine methyltransferase [Herbaspirillum seropedicae]|uniref:DNA cytosine methyltransferase n=1 Tax=Herbaspirillum seropedicae TaxID=964 RepID=UPI003D95333D